MTIEELINLDEPLEPETVRQLYPTLSDKDIEKILTIKVIKDTNAVFEDMDVFENASMVLNNIIPDVKKMEGAKPEHIWKALDLIGKIRPEFNLSHEVQMYIKRVFNDHGYYFYPPLARLENVLLDDVTKASIIGPFPLKEDFLGIQTSKYLHIQEYLKEK